MVITGLSLTNFRSYSNAAYEFDVGVNIIVGPNASGKTNLLEAILVSCSGKSYRAKDIDLINYQQPWARLEVDTDEGKRVVTIEKADKVGTDTSSKKQFKINDLQLKRLSSQKSIPVVLFEPDHLRLLAGGPERRRDYLDNVLERTTPGYASLRRDYKRTLAQRNALLKTPGNSSDSTMFAWNIRLSELGGKITKQRSKLVDSLNGKIQEMYRGISETVANISIEYISDFEVDGYSAKMHKHLEKNLPQDRQKGFTSAGPHRHDFVINLNDHTAAVTASRGEVRSMLLALKMIELRLLESVTSKVPLLLLDDVFSELDGSRRKALTKVIKKYQTFITTTDADIVVESFLGSCRVIPLGN